MRVQCVLLSLMIDQNTQKYFLTINPITNIHQPKKAATVHGSKLVLTWAFTLVALTFAIVQVNKRPTFAAVNTEYSTGRQCFDANQKVLSADAISAITSNYYRMGRWVFFNSATKKIEQPKLGSKGAFYWQPRKDDPIDQTVYCVDGFCQYGTKYCTNWLPTLKAIVATQKEMRCYQSKDVNQVWYGWIDAQGIAKPADPGTIITLEPDFTCSKRGVAPAEWGYVDAPKDVPLPPASALQSSSAPISASGTKAVSSSAKIKASLIDLLKKDKKK